MFDVQKYGCRPYAGTEEGVPPFLKSYDRNADLHFSLAVNPPMSPRVQALTFLRPTYQGVEARQAAKRGHCPNGFNLSRPIHASLFKEP